MKKTTIMMSLAAALAVLILPANAAVTENISVPVSFSTFVSCVNGGAGEIVDFSGQIHELISMTISGNNVSMVLHENFQGLTGTGETTLQNYQGTGSTSESLKFSLQNPQRTETVTLTEHFITSGPNNNFTIHETAHITINANGTVTVMFDSFSAECR